MRLRLRARRLASCVLALNALSLVLERNRGCADVQGPHRRPLLRRGAPANVQKTSLRRNRADKSTRVFHNVPDLIEEKEGCSTESSGVMGRLVGQVSKYFKWFWQLGESQPEHLVKEGENSTQIGGTKRKDMMNDSEIGHHKNQTKRVKQSKTSNPKTPSGMAEILCGWWRLKSIFNHDHAFKVLGYQTVSIDLNRRLLDSTRINLRIDKENALAIREFSPVHAYEFKVPLNRRRVSNPRRDGKPGKLHCRILDIKVGQLHLSMTWDDPRGGENRKSIHYDFNREELVMTNRIKLKSPARANGPTECTYSIVYKRIERRHPGHDDTGRRVEDDEDLDENEDVT